MFGTSVLFCQESSKAATNQETQSLGFSHAIRLSPPDTTVSIHGAGKHVFCAGHSWRHFGSAAWRECKNCGAVLIC